MIYHTAAEVNYYNAFFKRWHKSIASIHSDAKFSLKFVGDTSETDVIDYTKANNIELILDPTTTNDLIKKYGSMETGRGYYPMARWNSIPTSDNVCVTDVDVVMVKDHLAEMLDLLTKYDIVSISRLKPKEKVNLMMVNYIKKDCCFKIRNHAMTLMDNKHFRWDIDLDVMGYIKKNCNLTYMHKLTKFDRGKQLQPELGDDSYFGYYSAVSIMIDNNTYPGGMTAKKAKYDWAESNNFLKFSNNQSVSQD